MCCAADRIRGEPKQQRERDLMIVFTCAVLLGAVAYIGYLCGHQDGTMAEREGALDRDFARRAGWLK